MSAFAPDHAGATVRPSPNFGERRGCALPDMVLLHYTGMESAQAAEDRLCDPASEVSAHYLVGEDGSVVQMVREADRAWHAGKSFWKGVTDINSCSIGIEIVNRGHALGYPDFPGRQIDAVIALCRDIVGRHRIPGCRVLAHSDVSPGRKADPGEKFPWNRLAEAGLGIPVPSVAKARAGPPGPGALALGARGGDVEHLQAALGRLGYMVTVSGCFDEQTRSVVEAFQRHFRPARVDGCADRDTLAVLTTLVAREAASET